MSSHGGGGGDDHRDDDDNGDDAAGVFDDDDGSSGDGDGDGSNDPTPADMRSRRSTSASSSTSTFRCRVTFKRDTFGEPTAGASASMIAISFAPCCLSICAARLRCLYALRLESDSCEPTDNVDRRSPTAEPTEDNDTHPCLPPSPLSPQFSSTLLSLSFSILFPFP